MDKASLTYREVLTQYILGLQIKVWFNQSNTCKRSVVLPKSGSDLQEKTRSIFGPTLKKNGSDIRKHPYFDQLVSSHSLIDISNILNLLLKEQSN